MSSTYAHYPSSLPSDCAILSRLTTNYEFSIPKSQPENTVQVTRRKSFPASLSHYYYRPLNPTIGVYPHNEASQHLIPSPTETSPLLNHPPVPRIEENIDYNASADKTSTVNMFWEELAVLTKYAIPNFGYARTIVHFY
jgi:MATE family multidrug resistance protein